MSNEYFRRLVMNLTREAIKEGEHLKKDILGYGAQRDERLKAASKLLEAIDELLRNKNEHTNKNTRRSI